MTTMIVDPPLTRSRLGVGFDADYGHPRDSEAWKRTIGTRKVSARLALLPEPQSKWDRVGLSAIAQILILTFFVIMPLFFPEKLKTALEYQVTPLAMPVTEIPVAPPPPPPPKIKATPAPPVKPVEAQLNPKQPHIFLQPKALQPKIHIQDTKAPELNKTPVFEAKLDPASSQPKRPKEDVKLNNLNTGSAAVPTVKLPPNKVQTGGFGDPNGMPGKGDPNHATTVNRQGSPALPGGPGYGNGTGGDKGVRGVVASTGFGNGTAIPPQGSAKHGTVQTSGFADETAAEAAPKKKAGPAESPTTPVDILEKPRPEYTAEGRSMKLEGDVVLDVVFLADGRVEVHRLVSGLGHGLDEAASRAAQQIKFKPAKRDGQPVDFPARVRIEFRLAY